MPLELAQTGYEAYGGKANWTAYNGAPMPQWDDLPEDIKDKWRVATLAIVARYGRMLESAVRALPDSHAEVL